MRGLTFVCICCDQLWYKHSVVKSETFRNLSNTVDMLPRVSTETDTIKVHLKRKLKYKNHVLSQNIRPSKVFEAAKWLNETGTLYREEIIKLNLAWADMFTECEQSCSSKNSSNLPEICRVADPSNDMLNTKEQTVSGNTELFTVCFNKVFICLDCEQVLVDHFSLENHLLFYHNVVVNDESFEESAHPVFHQNDCNSTEVLFFCSLCSAWEKDESLFTEHMTIVHDLPQLEENKSVQCINAAAIQIQNY